jgi:4-carboxymuconolactone decarboxylase
MQTKHVCAAVMAAVAGGSASAHPGSEDMAAVSPALARYTKGTVEDGLWERPGLSKRDRSIVTLAVLVARNQSLELRRQLALALDHGVQPGEVSELITHLAFYAGWGNATSAVAEAAAVFAARKVDASALPPAEPELLPLNEAAEAQRSQMVQQNFGEAFPGVVQYTTAPLFLELWRRPGLAPRDRSLVTVSALIANGQVAQVPYHLNRAMDNGLTRAQVSEALTQLAFYAGWPNVFSAMPVVKDVLDKRPK